VGDAAGRAGPDEGRLESDGPRRHRARSPPPRGRRLRLRAQYRRDRRRGLRRSALPYVDEEEGRRRVSLHGRRRHAFTGEFVRLENRSTNRRSQTIRTAAFILVVSVCELTVLAAREPRLQDFLSRLETYLTAYEVELTTLVAEEHYEQWVQQPGNDGTAASRRTLTSDFGFLRLPGTAEWLGLRDTFVVDGEPIPDRQGRLERLLSAKSSDLAALARQ